MIQLGGILQEWAEKDQGYHSDVNMLDLANKEKRFVLTNTFQSYCKFMARKWNDSAARNISDNMEYTNAQTTFWFNVCITDWNVKSEMRGHFSIYERIFNLFISGTDAIHALREYP